MHRCFSIPEIICMVCDQLQDDTAALSVLARTAKLFHSYALDILWKEQHDLFTLLKCMPVDLWETKEQDDEVLSFVGLLRPAIPSDLDRLLFYSRRVKLFIAHDHKNLPTEDLRTCLAGQTLFPRITALVWGRPERFCELPLYLGPNVKHLGVALKDSAPHLRLLRDLTRRYPTLQSVDISLPPSASTTKGVSDAVCSLRTVDRLTVNTLTAEALLHLAATPNLTVFNLMSVGDITMPETLPDDRFIHLQHMNVGAVTIEQCTSLLRLFSAAPLTTAFFALGESERSLGSAWASFAAALRDHCAHSSLRSIFVYHGSPSDPPSTRTYISTPPTGAALAPLLIFRHLTSLILEPPHGLDLDEPVLRDMAHAWPSIEKLVLGVSGAETEPRRTNVTLHALLPFAAHCPNLRTLGVVLHAAKPPMEAVAEPAKASGELGTLRDEEAELKKSSGAELKKSKPAHNMLTRLLLGPSSIADADVTQVAEFLAAVFPNLEAIVCSPLLDLADLWDQVGREMAQFLPERSGTTP
ncbi:hypothetical protein C8R43DRAFT_1036890 [Mycena crocata]|nr:hypothetical protein C8R43DRAFT_1036890 [Mycena crocata]